MKASVPPSLLRRIFLRATGLRALLLGANAFVMLLPVGVLVALRVSDVMLLRQTEESLMAESIVIGETFRQAWQAEHVSPSERRAELQKEDVVSIRTHTDFRTKVLPATQHHPSKVLADNLQTRIGRSMQPLLLRSKTFSASSLRVLNPDGCVIATSGEELGACLSNDPEVIGAMYKLYSSVLRTRLNADPDGIAIASYRRPSNARVFIALPILDHGSVIAIVTASRTAPHFFWSVWDNRRLFLIFVAAIAFVAGIVTLTMSSLIAFPLRRLTKAALQVADGASPSVLVQKGFVPREIRSLENVLVKMTTTLEERRAYVTEFASHASHELRTPITAIRGAAELLETDWEQMSEVERLHFVRNIASDATRMQRLVTQLLDLAQAENSTRVVDDINDVGAFIRGVLHRYEGRVNLISDHPPLDIRIPETQLESVLTNLVENALRHASDEKARVTISSENDRLKIGVSNQGTKITDAHLPRLFERFFTTERDRGGSGLGLALVKAIVESRAGTVDVVSSEEETTFRVTI